MTDGGEGATATFHHALKKVTTLWAELRPRHLGQRRKTPYGRKSLKRNKTLLRTLIKSIQARCWHPAK